MGSRGAIPRDADAAADNWHRRRRVTEDQEIVDRASPVRQSVRAERPPKVRIAQVSVRWQLAALDMVAEPVFFFSTPTEHLVQVNRAAHEQFGYTRHQLRRMSFAEIAPGAERGELANEIQRVTRGHSATGKITTTFRCRNGTLLPLECSIRVLQRGPVPLVVAVLNEINASPARDACVDMVWRDPLTGLPNREWLWRQLDSEIRQAQRSDYRFAVLFLDIDNFKIINDSHGHLAGDRVLERVARRIRSHIRPGDDLARFGGDEFVVLMKNVCSAADVHKMIERLGRVVTVTGRRQGKSWRVRATASVGAMLSSGDQDTVADAIDRADAAMYRAKALGRNGVFSLDDRLASAGADLGTLIECGGRSA